MKKILVGVIVIFIGIIFLSRAKSYNFPTNSTPEPDISSAKIRSKSKIMKITSTAFENNSPIPVKYSCDGENINPPLEFSGVPENTKSIVLLVDDPDVPKNLKPDGVFDHWVVYNLPPSVSHISENTTPEGEQGLNSAGQNKYTGPCPPDREHRYFFKLYALDQMLDFKGSEKVDKKAIEGKMDGHILQKAGLIGLFKRN